MRRIFILFYFLLLTVTKIKAEHTLTVHVKNHTGWMYVAGFNQTFYGYVIIDSQKINTNKVVFIQPKDGGLYKVITNKENIQKYNYPTLWLGNNENTTVSFDAFNTIQSWYVEEGNCNIIWSQKDIEVNVINNKLIALESFLSSYPDTSTIAYIQCFKEWKYLHSRLKTIATSLNFLKEQYPYLSKAIYAKMHVSTKNENLFPVSDSTFEGDFFYGIDFENTYLQNSSLLFNRITSFLSSYGFPTSFNKETADKAFTNLMLIILETVAKNYETENKAKNFSYIGTLLFDFSNYYNLPSSRETLLDWLSKMQSATTCETNLSSKKTQLLLNSLQYRKGKKIEMDTLFKDLLRDKENKLMIFWNSNCVHCSEMMPDLLNTLEKLKNRNIKLIMISTNDDNESFKKYLETNNKYIVNITSEKGSVLMNKFGILFSPTFFLIKDNTIFSKVETYEKFKKTLEEFKID